MPFIFAYCISYIQFFVCSHTMGGDAKREHAEFGIKSGVFVAANEKVSSSNPPS